MDFDPITNPSPTGHAPRKLSLHRRQDHLPTQGAPIGGGDTGGDGGRQITLRVVRQNLRRSSSGTKYNRLASASPLHEIGKEAFQDVLGIHKKNEGRH